MVTQRRNSCSRLVAISENSWKDRISLCFDHLYWLMRRPRDLRIVVIGAQDTGKTSVIRRFAGDIFYEEKTDPMENVFKLTTVLNMGGKKLRRFNTKIVEMPRKDTGLSKGDEFKDIHDKVSGYILVYDANLPFSYQKLSVFISEIQRRNRKLPPIIVVGNKSEICTKMSQVNNNIEIREDVESIGLRYFSTSAQQNSGISEAFDDIIEQCAKKNRWSFPFKFRRGKLSKRDSLLIEDVNQ